MKYLKKFSDVKKEILYNNLSLFIFKRPEILDLLGPSYPEDLDAGICYL